MLSTSDRYHEKEIHELSDEKALDFLACQVDDTTLRTAAGESWVQFHAQKQ